MSKFTTGLKFFYLSCLSTPAVDRKLYRAIRRCRPRKIVEIGVGSGGLRAKRMIELAERYAPSQRIHYTGIDLFEAREALNQGPSTLKQVYRLLKQTAARVRLVPGDPFTALARTANLLTETDLVIVSVDQDAESLSRAWFYVPRMLHAGSQVYLQATESSSPAAFRLLSSEELARLSEWQTKRQAA